MIEMNIIMGVAILCVVILGSCFVIVNTMINVACDNTSIIRKAMEDIRSELLNIQCEIRYLRRPDSQEDSKNTQ